MNKLPEFKPLPDVNNLRSNYMSAFNNGMNIYEALVYLQGYVQITYNSMDDLIDDWNNFEDYITENLSQIANEKTQEILNQWKSDGTLNEIIAQNPLWNQKVNKAGDVMSGDLQFQEEKGVYGTLHSGNKVNMISHSYTGTDDYTQIGDDNAQAVIHSEKRPVWYDGSKNQDLLVEEDLNTTKLDISEIQDKIETGAYFTSDVGGQPTITNYQENKNVSIIQPSDVVNNLNSSEKNKPLSALQGKILNSKINEKPKILWEGSFSSFEQDITLNENIFNFRQIYIICTNGLGTEKGMAFQIPFIIESGKTTIQSSLAIFTGNIRVVALWLNKLSTSTNIVHVRGWDWLNASSNITLQFNRIVGIR